MVSECGTYFRTSLLVYLLVRPVPVTHCRLPSVQTKSFNRTHFLPEQKRKSEDQSDSPATLCSQVSISPAPIERVSASKGESSKDEGASNEKLPVENDETARDQKCAAEVSTESTTSETPDDRPVQKNRKRCWKCKAKLELAQRELGLCKCGRY